MTTKRIPSKPRGTSLQERAEEERLDSMVSCIQEMIIEETLLSLRESLPEIKVDFPNDLMN
jgi:hypothetical protein